MTSIFPLHPDIHKYLARHRLQNKFAKQVKFLQTNPRHPGLHLELLEPKDKGIYSFRVDIKYRALFIYRSDLKSIEILSITSHYQ
jgi:Txe/YoeB family toxin of Txe-Axe toxin-antitoxin module